MINPQEYIQEAPWFKTEIPRAEFKELMKKNNISGFV